MRVTLLALALFGVAESVSLGKNKAFAHGKKVDVTSEATVLAYHGFKATAGELSMTVSKTATKLTDSEWASMKEGLWKNTEGPLAKLGYTTWQPTKDGLRVQNHDGKSVLCQAQEATSQDLGEATSLHFKCGAEGVSMLEKGSQTYPQVGALDKEDYDDHQKGELWVPAENGVPYGWNKLFKSFGFPYFTVTPKGFLGCYKLDHGMCSMTPSTFSTTGLQPPLRSPGSPTDTRFDLTPKFPQGTEYEDRDDLRTKIEDVIQNVKATNEEPPSPPNEEIAPPNEDIADSPNVE